MAVFFHKVCSAVRVLEALINGQPQNDDTRILGDVSTYFGVGESNGRGMLHLRGFPLWSHLNPFQIMTRFTTLVHVNPWPNKRMPLPTSPCSTTLELFCRDGTPLVAHGIGTTRIVI